MRKVLSAATVIALATACGSDGKVRQAATEPMSEAAQPSSAAAPPAADDSLDAADAMCRTIVRDKLTSPGDARFSGVRTHRDPATGALASGGTVTAPNPMGARVTHRYVCLVDASNSGRANAFFRTDNPALYDETVRLFHL